MNVYPPELTAQLKKIWTKPLYDREYIPKLPKDSVLLHFLETCYHASLKTEEKRRLKFKVAYYPRSQMIENQNSAVYPNKDINSIEFLYSRNFNVNELNQLAPATDSKKVIICIEADDSDRLKIWGMIDTGSSWWDFTDGTTGNGIPLPNVLTVSSQNPGELIVSRSGETIVQLKGGTLHIPIENIFYEGPVSNFFYGATADFIDDFRQELLEGRRKLKIPEGELPDSSVITTIIEKIIKKIHLIGHGGTLIVIPDSISLDDPRLKQRIDIKYPCRFDDLLNFIREYHLIRIESLYDTQQYSLELACQDYLSDAIDFISSLSGVDGAVVMTDKLRVLGFGGEITVHNSQLVELKKARDAYGNETMPVSIRSFGTRHRSAFRFCANYESAIAFVISQDGGITAVKECGPDLVIWQDIQIERLGA